MKLTKIKEDFMFFFEDESTNFPLVSLCLNQ